MTDTFLTLVRHGQTIWHAANRYAGVSDVPLSDTGRAQIRALGDWARAHPHDAVVCSPVSRARATAGPVADALGLEPEVVADLREVDFGARRGPHARRAAREPPGCRGERSSPTPRGTRSPAPSRPVAAAERVLGRPARRRRPPLR